MRATKFLKLFYNTETLDDYTDLLNFDEYQDPIFNPLFYLTCLRYFFYKTKLYKDF
jgi:hypothetical protein